MICVPIVARTTAEAVGQMERSLAVAQCVELRIDCLVDADLPRLIKGVTATVVVTNRRREDGGGFEGTERQRIERLMEALDLGADFVDVELTTEESLLKELVAKVQETQGRSRLIVSHHDWGKTASFGRLKETMERCWTLRADIAKIVTKANAFEDNLKILGLLPYARRRNKSAIAFCMGEMGRPSRVLAPLLGSYMTFASLDRGLESAPGQLTVAELRAVLSLLTDKGRGLPTKEGPAMGPLWDRSNVRPKRGLQG